ncbi:MAG: galactosyltransferase-related protein [archaeon]|nr:galactosyltransferase-related protein [archaeon]
MLSGLSTSRLLTLLGVLSATFVVLLMVFLWMYPMGGLSSSSSAQRSKGEAGMGQLYSLREAHGQYSAIAERGRIVEPKYSQVLLSSPATGERKHMQAFLGSLTKFLETLNAHARISTRSFSPPACAREVFSKMAADLLRLNGLLAETNAADWRAFVRLVPSPSALVQNRPHLQGQPPDQMQALASTAYHGFLSLYRSGFCSAADSQEDVRFVRRFQKYLKGHLPRLKPVDLHLLSSPSGIEAAFPDSALVSALLRALTLVYDVARRYDAFVLATPFRHPDTPPPALIVGLLNATNLFVQSCEKQFPPISRSPPIASKKAPLVSKKPPASTQSSESKQFDDESPASNISSSSNSLAIVVPVRDRETHLKTFLGHIERVFANETLRLLYPSVHVFVVEQESGLPFNRGKLLNAGYQLAEQAGSTHFLFHDVDMLSISASYAFELTPLSGGIDDPPPLHVATCVEQFAWGLPYPYYFGGVSLFSRAQFRRINGFSNRFWGWGGEDDDAALRVAAFWPLGPMRQPPFCEHGRFMSLQHPSNSINPHDEDFMSCRHTLSSRFQNAFQYLDGLNSLHFQILQQSAPFSFVSHFLLKI